MAYYKTKVLREGYDGEDGDAGNTTVHIANCYTVLVKINCAPDDEVLIIPSHYGKNPITHIGYYESYTPSHQEWVDWHHCKGGVYYPAHYSLFGASLDIPENIKKIIIPETVKKISSSAFKNANGVIFEVHPDNPYLTVEDNKIVEKK